MKKRFYFSDTFQMKELLRNVALQMQKLPDNGKAQTATTILQVASLVFPNQRTTQFLQHLRH